MRFRLRGKDDDRQRECQRSVTIQKTLPRTGFYAGGFLNREVRNGLLHFRFKVFARRKTDDLGSLDLHLFLGGRIDPSAGLASGDLKGAKAYELDGLIFLEPCFDAVDDGLNGSF